MHAECTGHVKLYYPGLINQFKIMFDIMCLPALFPPSTPVCFPIFHFQKQPIYKPSSCKKCIQEQNILCYYSHSNNYIHSCEQKPLIVKCHRLMRQADARIYLLDSEQTYALPSAHTTKGCAVSQFCQPEGSGSAHEHWASYSFLGKGLLPVIRGLRWSLLWSSLLRSR